MGKDNTIWIIGGVLLLAGIGYIAISTPILKNFFEGQKWNNYVAANIADKQAGVPDNVRFSKNADLLK